MKGTSRYIGGVSTMIFWCTTCGHESWTEEAGTAHDTYSHPQVRLSFDAAIPR